MKKAFDKHFGKLDMTLEKNYWAWLIVNNSQTELQETKTKQKKTKWLKKENILRLEQCERCNMCLTGISKGKKENRIREIFEVRIAKNFPKLMTDTKHQGKT